MNGRDRRKIVPAVMGGEAALAPPATGLVSWIKADALTLTDGNPISSATDLSGSNNHAVQGTALNRPIFKIGAINGHSAIRFAPDQYLTINGLASAFGGSDKPTSIYFIVAFKSVAGVQDVIAFANTSVGNALFTVDIGAAWRIVRRDDAGTLKLISSGTPEINTYYVSAIFTGTVGNLFVDGSQIGSADTDLNVGDITFDTLAFGARVSTSVGSFITADISEILIYNASHDLATRLQVQTYLTKRLVAISPSIAQDYQILTHGDSKTSSGKYQPMLTTSLEALAAGTQGWVETGRVAVGGTTVEVMAGTIAADLAALPVWCNPRYVLINIGANNINTASLTQATIEAGFTTIINAMAAKWSGVEIYLMTPWVKGKDAGSDTFAGFVTNVITANPTNTFAGPDERVFLKGADDGVTMMSDALHPNLAGYTETAAQWVTIVTA